MLESRLSSPGRWRLRPSKISWAATVLPLRELLKDAYLLVRSKRLVSVKRNTASEDLQDPLCRYYMQSIIPRGAYNLEQSSASWSWCVHALENNIARLLFSILPAPLVYLCRPWIMTLVSISEFWKCLKT
ncbi:Os02g0154100 [Oryza sativa Japonica Group]|uniref:Os02g0154100 protein n=1 Tax=Oryza sativa subsp. japonica TaxID=39947 RepID=A0A0P0VEV7_ORYSJ|nr:Os02g0154100 [Oryza sativa Japonica Group]